MAHKNTKQIAENKANLQVEKLERESQDCFYNLEELEARMECEVDEVLDQIGANGTKIKQQNEKIEENADNIETQRCEILTIRHRLEERFGLFL